MAVNVRNIIPSKQIEAIQTTQYTASNCKCIIDKFTATNNSGANVSFTVNLIPPGSSVSLANRILALKTITPSETYTCPELVGQILEPGGIISTIAGASAAITIMASGREVT